MSEWLVQSGYPDLVLPWINPITGERHDCWEHLRHTKTKDDICPSPETPEHSANSRHSEAISDEKSSVHARTEQYEQFQQSREPEAASVQSVHPQSEHYFSEARRGECSGVQAESVNTENGDNDYSAALGMPAADVIKISRSGGAPLIHLGPGQNCSDLEKLLPCAKGGRLCVLRTKPDAAFSCGFEPQGCPYKR